MSFDATKYTRSEWLHGSDLPPGRQTIVTIRTAYEHTFERDNQTRPVVEFFELEQKLACNKSQVTALIGAFGPNAAAWINQRVVLMAVPSNFEGKPSIILSAAQPDQPPPMRFEPSQPQPAQRKPEVNFQ